MQDNLKKGTTRKQMPVATGVLAYFPLAIKYISRVSLAGNEQHHPGTPLHYDKNKSQDHLDAATRHMIDHLQGEILDTDGILHLGKYGWRGLAILQKFLEENPNYLN